MDPDQNNNDVFTSTFSIPDHDTPIEQEVADNAPPSSVEESHQEQIPNQEQTHSVEASQNKRVNKNPFKKRISQLVHASQEKDNVIYQQQLRLQQAEELLRQRDQIINETQESAISANYNTLVADERRLIQELRNAKEMGDIDSEIKLQQALMDTKKYQTTLEMQQYQHQNQPAPNYNDSEDTYVYPITPEPIYEEEDYDEPEIAPAYASFLNRNRWANPNDPHYSEEILAEANEVAEELNKRLKFNQSAEMIGTDWYYKTIETALANQYGIKQEPPKQQKQMQQKPRQPLMQRQQAVYSNGVERRGSTMADQYMNRYPQTTHNAVPLDERTIKMARSLKIPDPRNPGHPISEEQTMSILAESQKYFRDNGYDLDNMTEGKISFSIPN
jgi:hypothetical protein